MHKREKGLIEKRVPEMVRCELDFVAVFADARRRGHDAGVADEDVQLRFLGDEGLGCGFHRREVG